jgi:hypothetical protein
LNRKTVQESAKLAQGLNPGVVRSAAKSCLVSEQALDAMHSASQIYPVAVEKESHIQQHMKQPELQLPLDKIEELVSERILAAECSEKPFLPLNLLEQKQLQVPVAPFRRIEVG